LFLLHKYFTLISLYACTSFYLINSINQYESERNVEGQNANMSIALWVGNYYYPQLSITNLTDYHNLCLLIKKPVHSLARITIISAS